MNSDSNDHSEPKPLVKLPPNVRIGQGTELRGRGIFSRFFSERDPAIDIAGRCLIDHVQFAVGVDGQISIGDECYFTNVVLLCEKQLVFGKRVIIGWNTNISDSDFHPLDPAKRIADAVACSPLSDGRPRPTLAAHPVVIEDDVWIGPGATILKGVRIGAGAFIEPGSMVTKDVAPRSRVTGNPARVVENIAR